MIIQETCNLVKDDRKLIEYVTLLIINNTLYANGDIDDNTQSRILDKINKEYLF